MLDNKIIGEGWNKVPSTNDPTAHAEVTAIRNACQNLQNFSLEGAYIYVNCEPCPMCLASIYWARISRIYCCGNRQDAHEIGFDDSVIYDEIAKKPSMRKIPLISAEIPLAKEVMQEWKKLPNKTISKSFGDVHANKNINLQVKKGEIQALLGENGFYFWSL